ncbi:MAG TPA: phage/plasmid primase, P4 family [Anaerovoracaceae bacterium]|nr:phage/plasmid primase, P4 family [Anaerovoracaceae bacterium]
MDNLVNESVVVNTSDNKNEKKKPGEVKPVPAGKAKSKKAPAKSPAGKGAPAKKTAAKKAPTKKKPAAKVKPPPKESIEYIYLNRKDNAGISYLNDYRRDGSSIYHWTGKFWQEVDDIKMEGRIQAWLAKEHNYLYRQSVARSIRETMVRELQAFDKLKKNDVFIPGQDYWISIDEKGVINVIEPVKEKAIKYQIDVKFKKKGVYKPKKLPEKSLLAQYLLSTLPHEEERKVLQEFAGYSLTNSCRAQKMLGIFGEGGNGKSVIIQLLTGIHPNPVSVDIEELRGFNMNLLNASIYFTTEAKKKIDEEFIKAAVTGDPVMIQGKFKEKQTAVLTGKWIMAGNKVPRIEDLSLGIFRRLIIIYFEQRFDNSTAQIDDLAEQILEKEKDIFLDWCLEGLQRLIDNKWKFTESERIANNTKTVQAQADKVQVFIADHAIEYDKTKTITFTKEKLFDMFIQWCDKNLFATMNSTSFWMRMAQSFPEIKHDGDIKRNGKRIVYLKQNPKIDIA